MQKWEYLEVFIDHVKGQWHDSVGRRGELVGEGGSSSALTRYHSGALLNELGAQGWELTGVETHIGGGGQHVRTLGAKWLFKRPGA